REMALLRKACRKRDLRVRQGAREQEFLCLGHACVELPAMQRKSRRPLERAAQLRLREAGGFGKVPARHGLGQGRRRVFGDSSELPWCQTTDRASRFLLTQAQEIDARRDRETVDVQGTELVWLFAFGGEELGDVAQAIVPKEPRFSRDDELLT